MENEHNEAWEQKQLIQWAKQKPWGGYLYHIANESVGGYAWVARNRQMGSRKGFPDLGLPIPMGDFHGLYIELKRASGGTLSKEQRQWLKALRTFGYRAEVCHGWEEAAKVLEEYMNEKDQDD